MVVIYELENRKFAAKGKPDKNVKQDRNLAYKNIIRGGFEIEQNLQSGIQSGKRTI